MENNERNKKIEFETRKALIKMKADPSATGFIYIIKAIQLMFENFSYANNAMDFYTMIASYYKTSTYCVERCIRFCRLHLDTTLIYDSGEIKGNMMFIVTLYYHIYDILENNN